MAWSTSDRKDRLPPNWLALRAEVFRLKGRACYVIRDGQRCTREATEVDHKNPSGPNDLDNLFPICTYCHRRKSSGEGWAALRRKRRQARARAEKQFGWQEEHPGENPSETFVHPWMK